MSEFKLTQEEDNNKQNIHLYKHDNTYEKSKMFEIKKSYSVRFNLDKNEIIKYTKRKTSNDNKCFHRINLERFRSKSHTKLKLNPEMVPQIKPKISKVNPSPMKLHKSKTTNGIQPFEFESYSDNEEKEMNEYIIKDDNSNSIHNIEESNLNGNTLNDIRSISMLRQEMIQIKLQLVNSNELTMKMNRKGSANDNNSNINLLKTEEKDEKKNKRKSLWKKFIINQHKEMNLSLSRSCLDFCSIEQINSLNNKKVHSNKSQSSNSFSILNILECAANERKLLRKSNIY